jgi:UDPglucose 6-dehydrogenase
LIRTGAQSGRELQVLSAVESANEAQKRVLVDKIVHRFGADLRGRKFALWGLAFKPNTDDMREAPSRVLVDALISRGASVCAYDPIAMQEAHRVFGAQPALSYAEQAMDALVDADALIIVTEWKEFRSPDFEAIKSVLRQPVLFDGRNMFMPALPEAAGIEYHAIGRLTAAAGSARAAA